MKGNFHRFTFDVGIRLQFSMCAAVLFHPNGDVLRGWTQRSSADNPLIGEGEGEGSRRYKGGVKRFLKNPKTLSFGDKVF